MRRAAPGAARTSRPVLCFWATSNAVPIIMPWLRCSMIWYIISSIKWLILNRLDRRKRTSHRDEGVAARVREYRAGLERRAAIAGALGWMLPSVGVEALMTRMARTDLSAQLAYQDRIRACHHRLREFYYGYLFTDRPFGRDAFALAPGFPNDLVAD